MEDCMVVGTLVDYSTSLGRSVHLAPYLGVHNSVA
jgi:hypothetical protein